MILAGETEMSTKTKGDVFLEMSLDSLDEMPSPRLLLTHLQYQFLPKRILENGNKIIRITRNPKDVCISYYHHSRAVKNYNYTAPLIISLNFFSLAKIITVLTLNTSVATRKSSTRKITAIASSPGTFLLPQRSSWRLG